MSNIKDWVREAAEEIKDNGFEYERKGYTLDIADMVKIIEEHCPFKKDTAYIEVGELYTKLDEILTHVRYMRNDNDRTGNPDR
jgi:hypothetical protein